MTTIRKLPIGIQSFEDLQRGDYLYVDKTEYIWNLVNESTVYFLSRPRRQPEDFESGREFFQRRE